MDSEPALAEQQSIVFEGRLGAFIGLAFVNLLLNIVTLGIYRFWSKTRIRHFLWANTSFGGDPLEYRGRGLELFIGALLGFAIILLPIFVISLVQTVLRSSGHILWAALLQLVLFAGLFYMIGVGMYRSERYMISRTSWRGIRGGMINRGWGYGGLYIKMYLLRIVTLGFASPYASIRLWNARMNETMFGSARVTADARWKPLFWRFAISMIGVFVIYGVTIALIAALTMKSGVRFKPGPSPKMDPAMVLFIFKMYGVIIVATLLAGLLLLSYHAAYWRQIFAGTRLETLSFSFNATAGQWLRYYIGNVLIIVLTLGLGLMVMPWRAWSFYMRHLQTVGALDTDNLLQTQLAAPVQGDGIADALGFSLTPF